MDLVAGVDSSTQSTKVLLCRADDGTVVGSASAPHPDGTECHPDHWWEALTSAGRGLLERADAIGVGAQQHGMVVLDSSGAVIRDAMLWNDVKSAPQAAALVSEFGGAAEWAARTGSVPTRLAHAGRRVGLDRRRHRGAPRRGRAALVPGGCRGAARGPAVGRGAAAVHPAMAFTCGRPSPEVLGYYRAQCDRSDQILASVA